MLRLEINKALGTVGLNSREWQFYHESLLADRPSPVKRLVLPQSAQEEAMFKFSMLEFRIHYSLLLCKFTLLSFKAKTHINERN